MRKVVKIEKIPKPSPPPTTQNDKKIINPSHLTIFRNTPIHAQTQQYFEERNAQIYPRPPQPKYSSPLPH